MRDPRVELFDAALLTPDDVEPGDVDPATRSALHLVRRRFGLSLPPPFVERPDDPALLPVRSAEPADGPAIAAVQRRSFRARYRGLLSDRFLDGVDFSYLGGFWTGRTAVSPSPRHRLLVAGRPGEVHAVVDTGPSRDPDAPSADGAVIATGEIRSFYLDPSVIDRGLGSVMLRAALHALVGSGFTEATLWVVEANAPARAFYERRGWALDGDGAVRRDVPVEGETLHEIRYRLPGGLPRT